MLFLWINRRKMIRQLLARNFRKHGTTTTTIACDAVEVRLSHTISLLMSYAMHDVCCASMMLLMMIYVPPRANIIDSQHRLTDRLRNYPSSNLSVFSWNSSLLRKHGCMNSKHASRDRCLTTTPEPRIFCCGRSLPTHPTMRFRIIMLWPARRETIISYLLHHREIAV